MSENALAVWEFRSNAEGITEIDIINALKGVAKHYAFQLELSDTGYLHYQGRMSLIKKRREKEKHILLSLLKDWQPNYLAPTVVECKGDTFYITKEDTRIKGPWTDKDKVLYIPRQIREVEKLYPWQQHIVDDAKVWDKRCINILYDTHGNNGKSILKTYIGVMQIGRALPFTNDYKDMMRIVMDTPKRSLYIVDIPRALKKEHMFNFFGALETLKDGYAYDDRYSFKEEYFDCPNIWVFMNVIPELSLLTQSRWKIWTIIDHDLVRMTDISEMPGVIDFVSAV